MHRALGLVEVKTLCPEEEEEEEEEQLSVLPRHRGNLGKPLEQESEEEEYLKEELELMEGKRHRRTGVEASYEKRRSSKSDSRYLREFVHCLLYLCVCDESML